MDKNIIDEDTLDGVLEWGPIDDRIEAEAPMLFERMRGMRVCSQEEVLSLIYGSKDKE